MSAKKVVAILVFAALALALVIGGQIGRQSLVQVSGVASPDTSSDKRSGAQTVTAPAAASTTANHSAQQATSASQTLPIKQPDLTLNARGALHTHALDDEHTSLPPALAADIEQRRIPQSQLLLTPNRNGGYSMDAKGQYHTVVVAFIDENGQLRTEERIVYPLTDQPPAIPAAPPAANAKPGKPRGLLCTR